MRVRGRLVLITTTVAALALAVGAPAQEPDDVENVRTSVTISQLGQNVAIGKVSSKEKECEPKRTVTLFKTPSKTHQPPDAVGKDRTDGQGDWVIRESLGSGTYYAIVSGDRRGDFNCRDDRSSNRSLP